MKVNAKQVLDNGSVEFSAPGYRTRVLSKDEFHRELLKRGTEGEHYEFSEDKSVLKYGPDAHELLMLAFLDKTL